MKNYNLTEEQEMKYNELTNLQKKAFEVYFERYNVDGEEASQKYLESLKNEGLQFAMCLEGIYENQHEFGLSLLDRDYSGSVLYEYVRHYIDGAKYAKDPLIDDYLGITYKNEFYVFYRNEI